MAVFQGVLALLIVGLVAGGFLLWRRSSRWLAQASRCTGTVLEHAASPRPDKILYHIVVTVPLANGESHQFTDPRDRSNPPPVGSEVPVAHVAADYRVIDHGSLYAPSVVCWVLAGMAAGLLVLTFVSTATY